MRMRRYRRLRRRGKNEWGGGGIITICMNNEGIWHWDGAGILGGKR